MPLYDYQCTQCGNQFEEVFSIHDPSTYTVCKPCGSLARKIITRFPGVTHGMVRDTHYNTTVGKVVRNDTEFKSELSRQSDEASERNQFPVSFAPIDHREARDHLGVTDEGLDSTYSREVAEGKRTTVKHL